MRFNCKFGSIALKFDVLIVCDPRFPGGTSTAIASEIQAMHKAGYRIGLVPLIGQVLRFPHPINAAIKAAIADGWVTLVPLHQKVHGRLCLLHHPQVFSKFPERPLNITADVTRLIIHHPPRDADGSLNYDIEAIDRVVNDLFGDVAWAPVGPKVRAEFTGLYPAPKLAANDWVNIINVDDFRLPREGFHAGRPVIGRHSRPDVQKWPDTREDFLGAYPNHPDISVRLMGYGEEQDLVVGQRPANWQIFEFGAMPVRTFLGTIDFFSYYHSADWIEAFGRSILEAAASGAVPVLPEHFRPLFKDAAVYSDEADVANTVQSLYRDQVAFGRQSEAGRDSIHERFGMAVGATRVDDLIGPPGRQAYDVAAPPSPDTQKVLFVTSNGVGMGHLTRALAVARRLGDTCTPIVASLSKAFGVAEKDGIEATYLPYHRSVGQDYDDWQVAMERDISDLLAFHEPNVFVFDGNVPYPGMMAALLKFPYLRKIWQRRGMWAPGAGEQHLREEPHFDAVIEPGELADVFDRGLTRERRSITVPVAPVLYLGQDEGLPRHEARAQLGIPEEHTAILLQLGSENNFDLSSTRQYVLQKLLPRPDTTVVNAEWLIRNEVSTLPDQVIRLREFPISRFLAAFDFAVSSAGYNTFHENIFSGLPTIFVANENPEQDEQWLRAHYAELCHLAVASRRFNLHTLEAGLARMLDPEERQIMRTNCLALGYPTGADEAAEFISDMAYFRS